MMLCSAAVRISTSWWAGSVSHNHTICSHFDSWWAAGSRACHCFMWDNPSSCGSLVGNQMPTRVARQLATWDECNAFAFIVGGKKQNRKRLDLPQAQQSIQMTVSCHEESVVCYFVENTTLWSYGGEKSKLLFSNTSAHSKDCDDRFHPAKHGPCQASLVFPRGLYKAKGEL